MNARRYQPSAEDAWRVAGIERWRWEALRAFAAEHPAIRWYVQARTPRACAEGPDGKIIWYAHGRRVVEQTPDGRVEHDLWGDASTHTRGPATAKPADPPVCPQCFMVHAGECP